jgi:hypothetical protein
VTAARVGRARCACSRSKATRHVSALRSAVASAAPSRGTSSSLWQDFPNQFFCDSWVVGFWRGRPWLAGRWIGKTSLNVGSSRFWIDWGTRHGAGCARSMCRGSSALAIARAFSRWQGDLRSANVINCTTSSPPGSGMRRQWKPSCLSMRIGSSVAAMPFW